MEEIKFAWIVFCFLLSLAVIPFSFSRFFAVHISAALFFTVLSDYFLLLRQSYITGVLLFCLVHICYISLSGGFAKLKPVFYATGKCMAGLRFLNKTVKLFCFYLPPYAAAIFFFELDALIMAAGLYAALFFMNISLSLRALPRIKKANGRVFIAGLILFILCDINVLIFNLRNYADLVEKLADVAVLLIWVFYTPAQFLLAVSGLDFSKIRG